ncbi:DMT family transporter [Primorskyibacter sp. 2E107]|uniref:DMT family transporter n=1 Tax=Primorskyibacter sp. 2E107 TaxID=3403458 RepID=UPI003AF8206E
MRLFALVTGVMVAFAANSVLNRAAVGADLISPMAFGVIRLWAGAATLLLLAMVLRGRLRFAGVGRASGVIGLLAYIFGFSYAYLALDSGLGALILFGTVQVTMFVGAVLGGDRPHGVRWIGAALALAGLAWLVSPTLASPKSGFGPAVFMGVAGIGWGIYSLAGRQAEDALMSTAANFAIAAPLALLGGISTVSEWVEISGAGLLLAVISGALTSGLGYALWYAVLPRLEASVAAVAQLTVPVIAMAGGMAFLSEPLTGRFVIAAAVILGGVALSVLGPRYFTRASSGS